MVLQNGAVYLFTSTPKMVRGGFSYTTVALGEIKIAAARLVALGLGFCSLTFFWLSGYAWAVARAGDVLRRPRIRRALDRVTGVVLVAFGLRLAA